MKLNLKNVLSKSTYKLVDDYCENGVDALALLHPENGAKIRDVVNTFQALADPKYVNIRKDWGNAMSSAPFETLTSAVNYADGKKNTNAFALKFRANNGFGLRFPLVNSYYDSNSKFKNYGCDNIGSILSRLQENLNFRLEMSDEAKEFVSVKEGVMRKVTSKLSHPIRKIRAKEIEDGFDPSHKGIGLKKTKLILDTTYNGQKLSAPEQMIAIVDFYNAKVVKQTAKLYKLNKNIDKSKILLASQILSDLVVSWGLDFGPENGREIDNALRLQLSNVVASLSQDKSLSIISEIATFSAMVMTEKLGIDYMQIILNRKHMGVEYLSMPNNFNDLVFGPTKNAIFKKEGEDVYYYGESAALLKVMNSKMYKGEVYATPEFEQEPSVLFEPSQFEIMDPLEMKADEAQPSAPDVIILGAVAEETQEEANEPEETGFPAETQAESSELEQILAEAKSDEDEFTALFDEDEEKTESIEFDDDLLLFPQEKPQTIHIEKPRELEIGDPEDDEYDADFRELNEKFGFVVLEKESFKDKVSKLGDSIKHAFALKKTVAEKTQKVETSKAQEDEHFRWVFPTKDVERIMKETTPATNWVSQTEEYVAVSDEGYETLVNEEGKEYLVLNHFEIDAEEKSFEPIYMINTEDGILGITESGEVKHNLAFAEDLKEREKESIMTEQNQGQQTLFGTRVYDVKNELDTAQTTLVASDNHKVRRETEEIQTTLVGTFIQDPAQTTLALFEDKEVKKVEKKISLPKPSAIKATISLNSEISKFKFSSKRNTTSALKRNYGMSL